MTTRFSSKSGASKKQVKSALSSRRVFSVARCLGLGFGLASAFVSQPAAQADTTWIGGTSQDWNDPANWSNGLPGAGNGITTINTTANTGPYPIFSTGTSQAGNDILIGVGTAGRLDQTGGTLFTGSGNWLFVGRNTGGSGAFNLSGGTFNASEIHVGATTGGTATGTVTVSNSGTINTSGWLTLADGGSAASASTGILNVTGGTVNVAGHLVAASAGNAGGTVNLTGGMINVGTGSEQAVNVNRFDTAKGQLNVNGGTMNLQNGSDILFSSDSGTGVSSLTLTSGAIVGGAGSLLNFMVTNVAGNNTVNLDGGTLTLGQIITTNATGTRVFNFNGGTLQAAAASTTYFAATRASAANVRNGGVVIDTNTFNITVGQLLQHSAVSGDAAKDGGLIKNGAGTLTLTAYSTFTGDVTINSGAIAGGADIGNVYTNSVLGNISDTLATARNINVGSGTTLTLTVGNSFGTGGSTNTLSQVALNLTGGTFQTGSQTGTGGYYNKIGAVNLNGGTIQVGTGANATNFQGLSLIGTVTVSGTTASTISNFAGSTAGSNGIHLGQNAAAGQVITFNVGVTGGAGADLTISAPLLNTSATLTASGLTKTGAGVLALTAANAYTDPTTVNAGTLLLSTGSVASGALNVTGGALTLGNNTALADALILSLVSGTTLNLNAANGSETIGSLFLDGNAVLPGT